VALVIFAGSQSCSRSSRAFRMGFYGVPASMAATTTTVLCISRPSAGSRAPSIASGVWPIRSPAERPSATKYPTTQPRPVVIKERQAVIAIAQSLLNLKT
jgi:hypothetical protein